MYFFLLILGLALWWAAHLFKRIAPGARAKLGNGGKGLVALALLASVVLMVIGFRGTPYINVWMPPAFATHINNLLVLVALFLFAAGDAKAAITRNMRHPMLAGMKTWAIAHLIVNGDLASIILFGGLLAWAVVEVITINRAEPEWAGREGTSMKGNIIALVGAVVVMGIIGMIHTWLGHPPFG